MSYAFLGVRGPLTGVADTTGFNPGNWTISFTPNILSFNVPECLVYKINVTGALGSQFNVQVENKIWDVNIFGAQNSWTDDSNDSLVIRKGETLYLLYSDPTADNKPPVATIFLRYDLDKWGEAGFA